VNGPDDDGTGQCPSTRFIEPREPEGSTGALSTRFIEPREPEGSRGDVVTHRRNLAASALLHPGADSEIVVEELFDRRAGRSIPCHGAVANGPPR